VLIGSKGRGRATLLAGNGTGIAVENAGNIRIENLVIRGSGSKVNGGYGILCDNLITNATRLKNLSIHQVDVAGFGIHGILISGVGNGFEHVRVTDSDLHDNLRGGMEIAGRLPYDDRRYAHADVVVRGCRAFGNTGDPNFARNHSGSGIVLYQVDGGSIERCKAWNNGALGDNRAGGGVGLWVCAARRVVIQECESFANKTRGMDGGGFDIDGGCEECVLQYNYSHDNDGPGLMVYTYPYASYRDRNNLVRFNISENDSRRSRTYAGLWIRADGRNMTGLEVHNNTVVIGDWSDQAASVHGEGVEARIRNNVFVSRGRALALKVSDPRPGVRFEGNLYWRSGEPFGVGWGNERFSSFFEWRNRTGQETSRGEDVGYFTDPELSPHRDGVVPFQEVGLRRFRAFRLGVVLPARRDVVEIGAIPAPAAAARDFVGRRIDSSVPFIGAVFSGSK